MRCVWLVSILETIDLVDSEFVFDWLPNSISGRFARFRRPDKPSAPKGRRFGRLWRDSRFHLRNSETRRICSRCYDNRARANFPTWLFCWKPRFHQGESETCRYEELCFWLRNVFRGCFDPHEVYRFQNLVGFELPIKHTHNSSWLTQNRERFVYPRFVGRIKYIHDTMRISVILQDKNWIEET